MRFRETIVGVAVCLALVSISYAEQASPDKLGVDQKLERLYELYRAGETVSLSRREMRFNLGVAYAVQDQALPGLRVSSDRV